MPGHLISCCRGTALPRPNRIWSGVSWRPPRWRRHVRNLRGNGRIGGSRARVSWAWAWRESRRACWPFRSPGLSITPRRTRRAFLIKPVKAPYLTARRPTGATNDHADNPAQDTADRVTGAQHLRAWGHSGRDVSMGGEAKG